MSRIWTALPQPGPLDQWHPHGVCWWRTPLERNADGHHLIIQTDSIHDDQPARLGCWEWFDDQHDQLIFGVDVFGVVLEWDRGRQYLDVLALPLLPIVRRQGSRWFAITNPDDPDATQHPTPSGFPLPMITSPKLPYPYAPVLRDESSVSVLPVTRMLDDNHV